MYKILSYQIEIDLCSKLFSLYEINIQNDFMKLSLPYKLSSIETHSSTFYFYRSSLENSLVFGAKIRRKSSMHRKHLRFHLYTF